MIARRTFLGASIAAAGVGVYGPSPAAAYEPDHRPPDSLTALTRLLDGNRRWVAGNLLHRDPAADRRRRVAAAQHPFAVVLTCIDSRVPPEYVFDQDLGDLFVVRTAAHVLGPLVAGSVEYGPAHGTPLVFVMGHTACGAIRATVESIEDGIEPEGHIGAVVNALTPAYQLAKPNFRPGSTREERVNAVVLEQVWLTAAVLQSDPLIAESGALVAAGCYSLDTGVVTRAI